MKAFFSFRKMITPRLIQLIFWFGVVVCEILGLVFIFGGIATANDYDQVEGGGGALVLVLYLLLALFLMVFGPIFTRICCETMIVLFRMNDTLTDIKDILERD